MRLIIATPLFPPDTEDSAIYIKELARRLAKNHTITVLLYGSFPESVENVNFVCIDKSKPAIIRVIECTYQLFKILKHADLLYASNGASIELPTAIVAHLRNTPFVLHVHDTRALARALARAKKNFILATIFQLTIWSAHVVIAEERINNKTTVVKLPPKKPEILPYKAYPDHELSEYEKAWDEHIKKLSDIFGHAA